MFQCEAKGSGVLEYQWLKDGEPALRNSHINIINNVRREDHGEYKCLVNNEAGSKSSQQESLNVLCK